MVGWTSAIVAVLATVITLNQILRRGIDQERQGQRRRLTTLWSDPKTSIGKTAARIPSFESLRIVSFGTSKTWGAGLADPDHESYTKLLSPNAVNLGLRATPADYPSLCLHSMIGDQAFDVIILEFSPFIGEQHEDFHRLARRLRARFPAAIIIYLPIYMLLNDVVYQRQRLHFFLKSVGLQTPRSSNFAPVIRNLLDADLSFPPPSYHIAAYNRTVNEIDGHIVEFPSFQNDIKNFVIDNAKYYANENQPWDFVHPSALGHQLIAKKIREKVAAIMSKGHVNTGALGTWLGGKDRCESWFSGGNITNGIHVTNMDLVKFTTDVHGKWAFEVGREGGSMTVDCLFPNCNIYISYMAKGPSRDYPRALLSVNGGRPTLVDPHIGLYHLRQIRHIGTATKPGIVTISATPLPEDMNSPARFRITGVITTPTTY